jgi:hypothetical protein
MQTQIIYRVYISMTHTVGTVITFSFCELITLIKYTLHALAAIFIWPQASRLFGTCQGIRIKG